MTSEERKWATVPDPSYRDSELCAIADLVQLNAVDAALARLKELRDTFCASFNNFAGRLIDELKRRTEAMRMAHVREFIHALEAKGVNHAAAAAR